MFCCEESEMVSVQSGDVETQRCPHFLVSVGLINKGTEQEKTRLSDTIGIREVTESPGSKKKNLLTPNFSAFCKKERFSTNRFPRGDDSAVLRKKIAILFQFEIVDVM